jgi:crotonobetainyl-CoA:carnitine CoA-transferase CaiB-like acyl-CoA transferase
METALFDDITVLELAPGVAGPYATMQLGEFGARVIKIEPLQGDWTRAMGSPFADGESSLFLSVNRNKQRVALDVTAPEGLESVHQLIPRVDAIVLDLLPAEHQARHLTYADLSALNPKLSL